jgi:hypothetical protein
MVMLKINPEVCKACVNARTQGWNEWDDDALADGKVYCPAEKILWNVNEKPPETCYYLLETVIMEGGDAE